MQKLNILCIVDSWGWAHEFNARGVKKYSKHQVTVLPVYRGGLTSQIVEEHDVIFVFSRWIWNYFGKSVKQAVMKKPIILYCCGSYFGSPPSTVEMYAVCTERLVRECEATGIGNVVLLREGVDTEIFRPRDKPDSKTLRVGWAGNPNKKVKRFYLLKQIKYPVKTMTRHEEKYRGRGRSRKPMVDFYNSIDVYIATMGAGQGIHGVNLSLLEAMACGLPVVSTNIAGISELVPAEWLIPDTPDSLVVGEMNRKLAILEDKQLREKIGGSYRRYIVKFRSWKARVKDWDRAFERVANQ